MDRKKKTACTGGKKPQNLLLVFTMKLILEVYFKINFGMIKILQNYRSIFFENLFQYPCLSPNSTLAFLAKFN